MSDDSMVFLCSSGEVARNIHEGDNGYNEGFAEVHEMSMNMTKFFNLLYLIFVIDSNIKPIKHTEKWTNALSRV